MELRSNIEINKNLLKVGTEIYYCDCENYMSYTVTEVNEKGFECLENETKDLEYFFFSELQHGWDFK